MEHIKAEAAAGQLLEAVGREAFAYAWQLLRHREDALDAVQAAMVAAWRHRKRLRAERNSRGWFYRVLRNQCLDRLRARAAHPVAAIETDPADRSAREPIDDAVDRESVEQLRLVFEALPDPMREILLLRDFHDLAYAEIAEALEVPVGTVMSRLHRARALLRERLLANE